MDALTQNTAQLLFPLYNKDIADSLLLQLYRRRQPCGAAPYDNHITFFHYRTSPNKI